MRSVLTGRRYLSSQVLKKKKKRQEIKEKTKKDKMKRVPVDVIVMLVTVDCCILWRLSVCFFSIND